MMELLNGGDKLKEARRCSVNSKSEEMQKLAPSCAWTRFILNRPGGGSLLLQQWWLSFLLAFLSNGALGQWLNYPASGTPRTHDGKPNLSAPVPRASNGK